MKVEKIDISGRECFLYQQTKADYLLVQPVDEHDSSLIDKEVDILCQQTTKPFNLVTFRIKDWNKELTPWPAPPVFGREPFGEGATETLGYVMNELLPFLNSRGKDARRMLWPRQNISTA